MQNNNPEPRKNMLSNKTIGTIAFAIAIFMFASIIYKYVTGF